MITIALHCPFCGTAPRIELGKKGHCQLHGDPFQGVIIRCADPHCHAKPKIEAGDIYNGGELKAREEAVARWNKRRGSDEIGTLRAALLLAQKFVQAEYDVRLNSYTLDGDYSTLTEEDAPILSEALECLAVINNALFAPGS